MGTPGNNLMAAYWAQQNASVGGYEVDGITTTPSSNGTYLPTGESYGGYPIYSCSNSLLFFYGTSWRIKLYSTSSNYLIAWQEGSHTDPTDDAWLDFNYMPNLITVTAV